MVSALLALTVAAAPLNVAVLYFDNRTGQAEYDVLRKGLADMLVTDLAGVPPLQIVERERLEALLAELKLQRSSSFDAATAQRLGKLVGASHAIGGSIHAVAPAMRLDVRLVEVATGKVLVTGSVTGKSEGLFELEQELVRRFAGALDAKLSGAPASGRANVAGLLAFSQGLDHADRGELDLARSRLGEAVRAAPEFARAKAVYLEILRRVREAEKRRKSEQGADEAALERSIEAWCQRRLADQRTPEEVGRYFAYRAARSNLALLRMRRLLGVAEKDEVVFAPPSKRAELARLEALFLENGERFAADLREYRRRGRALEIEAELAEEDAARSEAISGEDLGEWTFATAVSVAGAVAEFLVTGTTPHWSDLPAFTVRPAPVQREPALQARADALFEAALRELPLDYDADAIALHAAELLLPRGDGLVLLGKKEEAIAQWQRFLDGWPKAEEFPILSGRIETLLLMSDEVERDQAWIGACGAPDAARLLNHATRILRAEGPAGLAALVTQLRGCAQRQVAWAPHVFSGPAAASLSLGDCATYRSLRESARQAKSPLPEPRHHCDEP